MGLIRTRDDLPASARDGPGNDGTSSEVLGAGSAGQAALPDQRRRSRNQPDQTHNPPLDSGPPGAKAVRTAVGRANHEESTWRSLADLARSHPAALHRRSGQHRWPGGAVGLPASVVRVDRPLRPDGEHSHRSQGPPEAPRPGSPAGPDQAQGSRRCRGRARPPPRRRPRRPPRA